MKIKGLANCYRCFYRLRISPSAGGKAFLATCCNNMFRAQNQAIVREGLREGWNSSSFRFQRKLASEGDWSFCKGSSCFFYPYFDESKLLADPQIKEAISGRQCRLTYLPRAVNIIPSYSCNNNCYMCYHVSQRDRKKEARLSDALLEEIEKDIIPAAEFVTISGGEPLFSRRTREFIARVMSAHPQKRMLINTNGVLLHEYGLKKIAESGIFLNITLYGMEDASYEAVTGTKNLGAILENIQNLLDLGYRRMRLLFIVTSRNYKDSDKFCSFVEKNRDVKGIIRNNCFEGARYWGLMRRLEMRHGDIASRLKFIYQSESLLNSAIRRIYDPFLLIKYLRKKKGLGH